MNDEPIDLEAIRQRAATSVTFHTAGQQVPQCEQDRRALLTALDREREEAASIIERWRRIAYFGGTDYTIEEVAVAAQPLAEESDAWLARFHVASGPVLGGLGMNLGEPGSR